jgi:dihydrofolate synthase/folylpolyglutamate synthase
VVWRSIEHGEWGQKLLVRDFENEYRLSMPLLGDHQQENAATAIATLSVLRREGWPISDSDITEGFADVRWPGRMEELGRRPIIIADGAHNGDSARRLREALLKYFEFRRAILVVGVSLDKNVEDIASELVPLASTVILTKSRHMRAADPGSIADAFRRTDIIVETTENVKEALTRAREIATEEDLICATGSLFVVGEAIEAIKRVPVETY